MTAPPASQSALWIRPRAFRCSLAEVLGNRPFSAGLEKKGFPARGNCPGLREENGEDAAARNRPGADSREINLTMRV